MVALMVACDVVTLPVSDAVTVSVTRVKATAAPTPAAPMPAPTPLAVFVVLILAVAVTLTELPAVEPPVISAVTASLALPSVLAMLKAAGLLADGWLLPGTLLLLMPLPGAGPLVELSTALTVPANWLDASPGAVEPIRMTPVAAPIPTELPTPSVTVVASMSLLLVAATVTAPVVLIALLRTVAATWLFSRTTLAPAPTPLPMVASAPAPVVGVTLMFSVAVTVVVPAAWVSATLISSASVVLLMTVKSPIAATPVVPPSAPPSA